MPINDDDIIKLGFDVARTEGGTRLLRQKGNRQWMSIESILDPITGKRDTSDARLTGMMLEWNNAVPEARERIIRGTLQHEPRWDVVGDPQGGIVQTPYMRMEEERRAQQERVTSKTAEGFPLRAIQIDPAAEAIKGTYFRYGGAAYTEKGDEDRQIGSIKAYPIDSIFYGTGFVGNEQEIGLGIKASKVDSTLQQWSRQRVGVERAGSSLALETSPFVAQAAGALPERGHRIDSLLLFGSAFPAGQGYQEGLTRHGEHRETIPLSPLEVALYGQGKLALGDANQAVSRGQPGIAFSIGEVDHPVGLPDNWQQGTITSITGPTKDSPSITVDMMVRGGSMSLKSQGVKAALAQVRDINQLVPGATADVVLGEMKNPRGVAAQILGGLQEPDIARYFPGIPKEQVTGYGDRRRWNLAADPQIAQGVQNLLSERLKMYDVVQMVNVGGIVPFKMGLQMTQMQQRGETPPPSMVERAVPGVTAVDYVNNGTYKVTQRVPGLEYSQLATLRAEWDYGKTSLNLETMAQLSTQYPNYAKLLIDQGTKAREPYTQAIRLARVQSEEIGTDKLGRSRELGEGIYNDIVATAAAKMGDIDPGSVPPPYIRQQLAEQWKNNDLMALPLSGTTLYMQGPGAMQRLAAGHELSEEIDPLSRAWDKTLAAYQSYKALGSGDESNVLKAYAGYTTALAKTTSGAGFQQSATRFPLEEATEGVFYGDPALAPGEMVMSRKRWESIYPQLRNDESWKNFQPALERGGFGIGHRNPLVDPETQVGMLSMPISERNYRSRGGVMALEGPEMVVSPETAVAQRGDFDFDRYLQIVKEMYSEDKEGKWHVKRPSEIREALGTWDNDRKEYSTKDVRDAPRRMQEITGATLERVITGMERFAPGLTKGARDLASSALLAPIAKEMAMAGGYSDIQAEGLLTRQLAIGTYTRANERAKWLSDTQKYGLSPSIEGVKAAFATGFGYDAAGQRDPNSKTWMSPTQLTEGSLNVPIAKELVGGAYNLFERIIPAMGGGHGGGEVYQNLIDMLRPSKAMRGIFSALQSYSVTGTYDEQGVRKKSGGGFYPSLWSAEERKGTAFETGFSGNLGMQVGKWLKETVTEGTLPATFAAKISTTTEEGYQQALKDLASTNQPLYKSKEFEDSIIWKAITGASVARSKNKGLDKTKLEKLSDEFARRGEAYDALNAMIFAMKPRGGPDNTAITASGYAEKLTTASGAQMQPRLAELLARNLEDVGGPKGGEALSQAQISSQLFSRATGIAGSTEESMFAKEQVERRFAHITASDLANMSQGPTAYLGGVLSSMITGGGSAMPEVWGGSYLGSKGISPGAIPSSIEGDIGTSVHAGFAEELGGEDITKYVSNFQGTGRVLTGKMDVPLDIARGFGVDVLDLKSVPGLSQATSPAEHQAMIEARYHGSLTQYGTPYQMQGYADIRAAEGVANPRVGIAGYDPKRVERLRRLFDIEAARSKELQGKGDPALAQSLWQAERDKLVTRSGAITPEEEALALKGGAYTPDQRQKLAQETVGREAARNLSTMGVYKVPESSMPSDFGGMGASIVGAQAGNVEKMQAFAEAAQLDVLPAIAKGLSTPAQIGAIQNMWQAPPEEVRAIQAMTQKGITAIRRQEVMGMPSAERAAAMAAMGITPLPSTAPLTISTPTPIAPTPASVSTAIPAAAGGSGQQPPQGPGTPAAAATPDPMSVGYGPQGNPVLNFSLGLAPGRSTINVGEGTVSVKPMGQPQGWLPEGLVEGFSRLSDSLTKHKLPEKLEEFAKGLEAAIKIQAGEGNIPGRELSSAERLAAARDIGEIRRAKPLVDLLTGEAFRQQKGYFAEDLRAFTGTAPPAILPRGVSEEQGKMLNEVFAHGSGLVSRSYDASRRAELALTEFGTEESGISKMGKFQRASEGLGSFFQEFSIGGAAIRMAVVQRLIRGQPDKWAEQAQPLLGASMEYQLSQGMPYAQVADTTAGRLMQQQAGEASYQQGRGMAVLQMKAGQAGIKEQLGLVPTFETGQTVGGFAAPLYQGLGSGLIAGMAVTTAGKWLENAGLAAAKGIGAEAGAGARMLGAGTALTAAAPGIIAAVTLGTAMWGFAGLAKERSEPSEIYKQMTEKERGVRENLDVLTVAGIKGEEFGTKEAAYYGMGPEPASTNLGLGPRLAELATSIYRSPFMQEERKFMGISNKQGWAPNAIWMGLAGGTKESAVTKASEPGWEAYKGTSAYQIENAIITIGQGVEFKGLDETQKLQLLSLGQVAGITAAQVAQGDPAAMATLQKLAPIAQLGQAEAYATQAQRFAGLFGLAPGSDALKGILTQFPEPSKWAEQGRWMQAGQMEAPLVAAMRNPALIARTGYYAQKLVTQQPWEVQGPMSAEAGYTGVEPSFGYVGGMGQQPAFAKGWFGAGGTTSWMQGPAARWAGIGQAFEQVPVGAEKQGAWNALGTQAAYGGSGVQDTMAVLQKAISALVAPQPSDLAAWRKTPQASEGLKAGMSNILMSGAMGEGPFSPAAAQFAQYWGEQYTAGGPAQGARVSIAEQVISGIAPQMGWTQAEQRDRQLQFQTAANRIGTGPATAIEQGRADLVRGGSWGQPGYGEAAKAYADEWAATTGTRAKVAPLARSRGGVGTETGLSVAATQAADIQADLAARAGSVAAMEALTPLGNQLNWTRQQQTQYGAEYSALLPKIGPQGAYQAIAGRFGEGMSFGPAGLGSSFAATAVQPIGAPQQYGGPEMMIPRLAGMGMNTQMLERGQEGYAFGQTQLGFSMMSNGFGLGDTLAQGYDLLAGKGKYANLRERSSFEAFGPGAPPKDIGPLVQEQIQGAPQGTMGIFPRFQQREMAMQGQVMEAGIAKQSANLERSFEQLNYEMTEYLPQMRALNKEQRDMSSAQQARGVTHSLASLEMSTRQQLETLALQEQMFKVNTQYQRQEMAISRQQFGVTTGWQREDMAASRQFAGFQFEYQQGELERNIRLSGGRQRAQLMRQKEYGEEVFSFQEGQRGRESKQFETRTSWQEDQQNREKEHFEEVTALQQQMFDMQRSHIEERYALEKGYLDEQMGQIGAMKALQEKRTKLEEEYEDKKNKWQMEELKETKAYYTLVNAYQRMQYEGQVILANNAAAFINWQATTAYDKLGTAFAAFINQIILAMQAQFPGLNLEGIHYESANVSEVKPMNPKEVEIYKEPKTAGEQGVQVATYTPVVLEVGGDKFDAYLRGVVRTENARTTQADTWRPY
jgi:hypothetical protein